MCLAKEKAGFVKSQLGATAPACVSVWWGRLDCVQQGAAARDFPGMSSSAALGKNQCWRLDSEKLSPRSLSF